MAVSVGVRSNRRGGFTLIELVVVLIIIATIAGLVIPMVAGLGRSSDMAATAKTQADIASNLQLFFTLQKRFPQGLDSLIETGGTDLYAPEDSAGGLPASEAVQTTGLPISGPSLYADLTVGPLTNAANAEFLRSFTRCGFDWIYDHDRAVINSNNSATSQRLLSGSTQNVALVTSGSAVAKKLLPGTQGMIDAAKYKLVALGVGAGNSAIGKTLTQAPIYPGCDGKYYGRYVAVFQVYATGERATLLGVVDAYGRAPDYTIQQFNESLPDGGRQG